MLNSVSLHGGRRNLPSLPSFPDLGDPSTTSVKLARSCNGLVLLVCHKIHTNYCSYYEGQFIVCNLITKQYTILPCSHPFASSTQASNWYAYLAFDPSRSPHYKVLLIRPVFRLPFQIDVYCSQSKGWKQMSTQQRYHSSGGVFWNGAFHLLCHDNGIWRFNVDAEEMKVIPTPQTPKIFTDKIKYFGESGGNLVLIQPCQRYDGGLQILEMDKDYCGWMVKCLVDLRPLKLEFPEMIRNYWEEVEVMYVVKEDKEKDVALALSISDKIISFNLKWKTWNVLHEFRQGQGFHFTSFGAFPFIESLSPV